MSNKNSRRDQELQIWGWLLFIASAVFFIASSVRSGDIAGLLGGLFFLVACFFFLFPFMGRGGRDGKDEDSAQEYRQG